MSIAVLRNDGILPIATQRSVALIGVLVDDVALAVVAWAGQDFVFQASGFTLDGSGDEDALRASATTLAAEHEIAVVLLVPVARSLPAVQRALLDAVLQANPRTVVVVSGVVTTPPLDPRVRAVVVAPPQEDPDAVAEALYVGADASAPTS